MQEITDQEILDLEKMFSQMIGLKIDWLSIPNKALSGFEPSQIAVIINTLLDGILPQIELLATDPENLEKLTHIGLSKAPGELGEREGYPDYVHISGKRVELKGLFVDNAELKLKRPPTRREPSARLKENITMQKIDGKNDVLLIAAIQLKDDGVRCYPFIIDIAVFSMIECIRARDKRLINGGGKWFGDLPKVISVTGRQKIKEGIELTDQDYEMDTNFGKLKRIPYPPLQTFLAKYRTL